MVDIVIRSPALVASVDVIHVKLSPEPKGRHWLVDAGGNTGNGTFVSRAPTLSHMLMHKLPSPPMSAPWKQENELD
jgi:hypothetical protein